MSLAIAISGLSFLSSSLNPCSNMPSLGVILWFPWLWQTGLGCYYDRRVLMKWGPDDMTLWDGLTGINRNWSRHFILWILLSCYAMDALWMILVSLWNWLLGSNTFGRKYRLRSMLFRVFPWSIVSWLVSVVTNRIRETLWMPIIKRIMGELNPHCRVFHNRKTGD